MSARALFKQHFKLKNKPPTRCFSSSQPTNADFTHAVIGAGVVGLATARQLAAREGTSTILLERHDAPGTETSSRNSEVIHAGLYYPAASLKTNLCIRGRNLLYDLCAQNNIPHRNTKKWIVAQNPTQWEACLKVHAHAQGLGDAPTRLVGRDEAQRREPDVKADAGIVESETSGIVDSHSLMTYLQGDFEDRGGDVAFKTRVTAVEAIDGGRGGYKITAVSDEDGSVTSITAETLVNSAGHGACDISNMLLPQKRHVVPHYAKGTYFSYAASRPRTSVLVYPATLPGTGGLGTHLTLDMGGRVRFGPDVEWVDSPDDLAPSAARLERALPEIKAYLPGVDVNAIALDYCGIRPKLGRGGAVNEGKGFQDFIIREEEGLPGFINLLGIESPGLTSCLAIGEMVNGILYPPKSTNSNSSPKRMTSLLTTLGLRASLSNTPNYGPIFLTFNFALGYGLLSSRTLKQWYGLDHQVSPREDLTKYGEAAVREGKITRRQLDMLKRNESAHANAVENFPLLVAGVLFASLAGVPAQKINAAALSYTVARIVYGAVYILVDHPNWSQVRGLVWWWGNSSCLFLLWKAAELLA
ncbi:unnamed protein product [Penicillium egyptiacum]|uniref:L-2-hydroxyglutarate dehydrogenase, mitochondrial n=1 Tax=Penicillium egyptiacum TaxID=1303716 RepID=A0A9W4KCT1_9EURO|nr:unnamed protein product [Penicillium egyptiacum]